jgi:hypothetical protein
MLSAAQLVMPPRSMPSHISVPSFLLLPHAGAAGGGGMFGVQVQALHLPPEQTAMPLLPAEHVVLVQVAPLIMPSVQAPPW